MIWDEVLNYLKNEISNQEMNNYISKLKFDESAYKADFVLLFAPNVYIKNWVILNFSSKIANAFEVMSGIKPNIKLEVASGFKNVKKIQQQTKNDLKHSISPRFTFENFIQGESNKNAFLVAKRVAEIQAKAYNPLWIYGNTGLGKTHLLNAIANLAKEKDKKIIFSTAEEMMNDFSRHLQVKTMASFHDLYRNCDYLLIDDIQFLGGKEQLQEEFFNTFQALHKNEKQIVMTSDRLPKNIKGLEDRLRSRFESGMIMDIQPPGIETKIKIIEQKCLDNKVVIDREFVNYMAENISDNIRQIESIITKIHFFAAVVDRPVDLDIVKRAVNEVKKESAKGITANKIIKVVCEELNVKESEIKSGSRVSSITKARHIIIYLTRKLAEIGSATAMIAENLNMKDHSSVSKAYTKIEKNIKNDENLKRLVKELEYKIQND